MGKPSGRAGKGVTPPKSKAVLLIHHLTLFILLLFMSEPDFLKIEKY